MLSRLYQFIKNSHIVSSPKMMTSSTQIANKVTSPTPNNCSYRISAGTPKTPLEKVMPSATHGIPQQIQSDTSGLHKVAVVETCPEPQCHKRFCDTVHEKVCLHKSGTPKLTAEMAGALTHKVPNNKQGVLLDNYDANGKAQPQYMVKEETTIPIDMGQFKINEKITEYVQKETRAIIIKDNLPVNSVLDLKNTSLNDTALDENL